ncbi:MAG: hypothetical protein N2654_00575 [Deltaproteobacteria bacterium]|nr:hypothetical protein [Deltaproteobacteria bacterium]
MPRESEFSLVKTLKAMSEVESADFNLLLDSLKKIDAEIADNLDLGLLGLSYFFAKLQMNNISISLLSFCSDEIVESLPSLKKLLVDLGLEAHRSREDNKKRREFVLDVE